MVSVAEADGPSGGLGARLTALSGRVDSILVEVVGVVNDRLVKWSDGFFKDTRAAATSIASKMDYLSDSITGRCSNDPSDDVDDLEMLKSEAELIDRLRVDRPATYSALRDAAFALSRTHPLKMRDAVAVMLNDVEAADKAERQVRSAASASG